MRECGSVISPKQSEDNLRIISMMPNGSYLELGREEPGGSGRSGTEELSTGMLAVYWFFENYHNPRTVSPLLLAMANPTK